MQISERLLVDHPGDTSMRVSPETIYTSLFVQTKAVLRPELTGKLRTRRVRRRPHRRVNASTESKQIPAMASIRNRPAEASDRRTPGHWESQCCCQAAGVSAAGRGSR
jgi:IS30 family transposase